MKASFLTKETIFNLGISNRNFSNFKTGDTICVSIKIKEGTKERIQDFTGLVIAQKGSGISKTFTVRKITDGISIERVFPYYSPIISNVSLIKEGIVRRAHLNYIRDRFGRNAEIKSKHDKSF